MTDSIRNRTEAKCERKPIKHTVPLGKKPLVAPTAAAIASTTAVSTIATARICC